tara:strand:- start:29 stop:397 length:369 start_codon:yes stop_codon:yes gene_type:complete
MTDFIRKITFDYIKKDGEESVRNIIAPKFLKESFNSFTEIDKEQVNYVSGFEINTDDLESDEIKEYEETICDYFNLALPTMEEYFNDLGLDYKRVKQKSFKKDGVKNHKIIKDGPHVLTAKK